MDNDQDCPYPISPLAKAFPPLNQAGIRTPASQHPRQGAPEPDSRMAGRDHRRGAPLAGVH